jgi:hypothetical protein
LKAKIKRGVTIPLGALFARVSAFALLFGLNPCANAALMSHFKGRYGAIELFDSGKKLSFRVNAPELSQIRNFCQFHDLSTAIAVIEIGLLPNFEASVAQYLPPSPGREIQPFTLKQALRAGTPEVFSALRAKISAAQLATLNGKSALPTKLASTSAFALLDWFKALNMNALALKPATKDALRSLLTVKSRASQKLLAFSSRCTESSGAVGASVGMLIRVSAEPVYFAISVDGKSRADLFYVAPNIRDAALNEFGYWPVEVKAVETRDASETPAKLGNPIN